MMDLMQSAADLFSFFEQTPDLVCIAGKNGYLQKVNPAVVKTLGFSFEELYASPIETFIHPDDREKTALNRSTLLKGKVLHNFQNRYISKKGDTIWLDWTSIYFPEKEFVFALARNISSQKAAEFYAQEQYNKYKGLAAHFKSSMEKDRKYLAYELHEELAQLAAGVKMQLETIPFHMPEMPAAGRDKLDHAVMTTRLLIKTLQRLSFSISPAMLDQFGLDATLKWLCREFSILTGQHCTFGSDYEEANLSHEIKTDFFRISQEALSNVMQHSKASQAGISIYEINGKIILCITDNGTGFDPDQTYNGAGIVNMRERASSIGGELDIQSKTGEGTKVCVTIDN